MVDNLRLNLQHSFDVFLGTICEVGQDPDTLELHGADLLAGVL